MSTVMVRLDEVKVGPRLRKVGTPEDLSKLAESMAKVGLINPIKIRRTGWLVAGANRLAAAGLLGWEKIEATVCDLDDLHAELAEIDENLMRKGLSVLEEGEHLVRREEILAAINREPKAGRPTTTENGETRFTVAELAEDLGLNERSVQYRKQIANGLPQQARDVLRGIDSLADSVTELLSLTRTYKNEPDIADEVTAELAQGKIKHVDTAKAVVLRRRALAATPTAMGGLDLSDLDELDQDDLDELEPEVEDGPGADVIERLDPVTIEVRIKYKTQNPKLRHRGDKVSNREALDVERVVRVICASDVLDGYTGLRRMGDRIGEYVVEYLSGKGWPVVDRPTAGAPARAAL